MIFSIYLDLLYFNNVCSSQRRVLHFVKFIPMYLILSDAFVDGIVFLISFLDCSLKIYRNS